MAKNRPVATDAETSLANELPAELSAPTELGAPPVDAPSGDDAPPPTRPGDKPPETPASPELLTPNEWALRKGLLVDDGREVFAKGFHAEAEQLYGWKWHAHNFQAPEQAFRLTEADYDAALEAAGQFPAKPAHEPAVVPHFPKPVVPEHIAKACAARDAAEAKAAAKKAES